MNGRDLAHTVLLVAILAVVGVVLVPMAFFREGVRFVKDAV